MLIPHLNKIHSRRIFQMNEEHELRAPHCV